MRLASLVLLNLTLLAVRGGAQEPMAPHPAPPNNLLSELTNATPTLEWYTVLDGVMGGRSNGTFDIADGRLTFTGTLNTNGGGFASLRTRPADLQFAATEGLRIRVRGDGRTYTMRVQQGGDHRGRDVSYRADFTAPEGDAWHDVWLPFRSFVPMWRGRQLDLPPVDPARIDALGLMIADAVDGPFRVQVEMIHAYGPFELDDLLATRRPLLLFAPTADDRRLAAQLADLGSSRRTFESRDWELVLVLERGPSRAGDRPLHRDDADALRRRFAVEPGSFALRLLGEDGDVRRTAAEPVAMSTLYDLIDAMPTRRDQRSPRSR